MWWLSGLLLGVAAASSPLCAQTYSENFDSGTAAGWVAQAGVWVVSGSAGSYTYDDASYTDAQDISVYTGAAWNTDYTYALSMDGEFGASANDFGAIFNYVDSTHYHELLLTPVGTAYLLTANGGSPTTVATVTGQSLTHSTWYSVSITRSGTLATVKVGTTTIFNNVGLAGLGTGKIGVSSTWNRSRFDSVSVTPTTTYSEDFSSGTAAGWAAVAGTWAVSAQTYDDTSQGGHDMAVYTGLTWNTGYTYNLSMWGRWGSYGNDFGALFNYVDSTHYHELVLTPTGTATLRTANGGSPTVVATNTGVGTTYQTWYSVSITRSGTLATVTLGGSTIFNNVGLADLGVGNIGVSGLYDLADFDNISVSGTSSDSTPPTVSMTAPTNGAYVKGSSVTVSADASDNVGVVGVQFKLDGSNLGAEDTNSPYSLTWDTTTVTDGSHTLTAVARDAANNTTTSTAVNVTVDNTVPTVSMTAPTNGGTVSGSTVTVSASASDNIGVTSVQFQLDGANLGSADTSSPYSITWDTTTVTDGSHTLTAVASDGAGNTATATSISVTVSNGTTNYAEDFSSGTAAGWVAVAGTWAVSAQTYDDTSQTAHDIAVYTGATWNTDYTYGVSMWGRWGSYGNDFGAIFNYVDSTHYHELVLTPVGTAYLQTANGGSPTVVATATGIGTTYQTWYDASIIRSGTTVTVTLGGSTIFNNVGLANLGAGNIGVSGLWDLADFDDITVTTGTGSPGSGNTTPNSYSENFNSGSAANWSATGTWSVGTVLNGTAYKNTVAGGTSVYTTNTWNSDYTLRASLQAASTGASAKMGLLYNYIDSNNYYKLLVAGDGSAQLLKKVGGGSETSVATASAGSFSGSYDGSGTDPWVEVELVRSGTGTTVRVNGARVFNDVAQTELTAGGIGLTDSGTTANFDNVSVTPTSVVAYTEDLSDGAANNFTVASGIWSVTNGYYQSTGGGSHDYAVYNNATWNTNYTYSVSVASSLTGSSNKLGVIYNYIDANNYYEVLLGGSGTAEIKKVVGGTTTAQGAAAYVGAGGGTNRSTNQWSEIRILRSGTTTTVNVNGKRVFTNVIQGNLGAGEIGVSAASNNAARFDNLTVTNGLDPYKKTFPKIAGNWIVPTAWYNATYASELEQYDMATISIYRSYHGGGTAGQVDLENVKSVNPTIVIADYTCVMETYITGTGLIESEVYNKLTAEAGPSGGTPTPNDWWARNNTAAIVSESASRQTGETNISYYVRPDTNGYRFSQWDANWWYSNVFSNDPAFDLVYEDNCLLTPPKDNVSPSQPDWNRDGTNDDRQSTLAMTAYRQGIVSYLMKMSQIRSPDSTLVMGNIGGQFGYFTGGLPLEKPEYQYFFNAALYEAIAGMAYSDEWNYGFSTAMSGYHSLVTNTRAPHLVVIMARGTMTGLAGTTSQQSSYGGGNSYAFMRYTLGMSLMDDGYMSYNLFSGYSIADGFPWFDEFNLYLGEPTEGAQTTAWSNGVYKRQFQNGLALVNPRGNGDQTVNVSTLGSYKHFSGTQDSTTNNGANVTSVTIKQGDGLILLKQ